MFVGTSFYSTPEQRRGFCDSKVKCGTDNSCPQGTVGSGSSAATLTGNCNTTTHACEMAAWCPPEASKTVTNVLLENNIHVVAFVLPRTHGYIQAAAAAVLLLLLLSLIHI